MSYGLGISRLEGPFRKGLSGWSRKRFQGVAETNPEPPMWTPTTRKQHIRLSVWVRGNRDFATVTCANGFAQFALR